MMKKLISIGEALIDFIPEKTNCALKEVPSFQRACGGAPANAAAACAKLGGRAELITQLGADAFGDYIVDTLNEAGVDTSHILRTNQANTALAFVSLKDDGQRDFSFYRKPSADMLLEAEQIQEEWFSDIGVLHFCSVDLIEAPVKGAHESAICYAKQHGALISFDPNIRLPLWDDPEQCQKTVREFLEYADIIKISDEELEFVSGYTNIHDAARVFFEHGAKIILYSMGKEGSMLLTPSYEICVPNCDVSVVDTTGAGDAIIGAFLYRLLADGRKPEEIGQKDMKEHLRFANYYSNDSVTKRGAITAYADMEELQEFIKGLECIQ